MIDGIAGKSGLNLCGIGNDDNNFSRVVFSKTVFGNGQIHYDNVNVNDMTLIYKLVD